MRRLATYELQDKLPIQLNLSRYLESCCHMNELGSTASMMRHTKFVQNSKLVVDDIKSGLSHLDSSTFTNLHILDRLPAIFNSRQEYANWRAQVAEGLGVDPLNVVIVGSTSVGISLSPNPAKFMRPFHSESDVDLAVVSSRHFDEAWRWLRNLGPAESINATAKDTADLLKWHRRSLVFDGTIATDKLLPYLPFGAHWASVLGRAGTLAPTQDRDVKARIYRDFDSLRSYHQRNVEKLMLEHQARELSDDPSTPALAEKDE